MQSESIPQEVQYDTHASEREANVLFKPNAGPQTEVRAEPEGAE